MPNRSMSDTDDDIFITQNTFRDASSINIANDPTDPVGDRTFDEFDRYLLPDLTGDTSDFMNEPTYSEEKKRDCPYPQFSDISDDELVATCQKIEMGIENDKISASDSTSDNRNAKSCEVSATIGKCMENDTKKGRFPKPIPDKIVLQKGVKSYSKATMSKCNWALGVFNEWKASRNETAAQASSEISAIRVELVEMTKDEIAFSLSRLVLEARKQNGDEYPAETIYELVISLQLYLATRGKEYRFLDDTDFLTLKNTLDARMKELASAGKRVKRKQAEVISFDEEETMWENVLGDDTPQKLLDSVIYLFGIHFALRAGQEHRNLRFVNSQITQLIGTDGRRYLRYAEDVSKSVQGGLKHRRITPKTVDAYENISNPKRCVVRLYEKYLSHRPSSPKCSDALYLRPLMKPHNDVWYSCQPLGIHKITTTIKRLCSEAGVTGYKTNHSLRATAASRLYGKEFDEQLVCETTGHRSSAVRSYKRTSAQQRKAVSDALYNSLDPTDAQTPPTEVSTSRATSATLTRASTDGSLNITVNVNLQK